MGLRNAGVNVSAIASKSVVHIWIEGSYLALGFLGSLEKPEFSTIAAKPVGLPVGHAVAPHNFGVEGYVKDAPLLANDAIGNQSHGFVAGIDLSQYKPGIPACLVEQPK